ncbi:tyrosine-type recombinase/integrase [Clostridium botulinum D/C]|uniref:tyrosine-type recombinase/integrase n=1 Tax=Clostridium botulinum TaxID=1491 RepID=UPI001E3CCCAA|nr:tyrosine-type recombinase/integrase [Clostridium botulinum]MCD3234312.1 tyrosine-type recombinase/integrase [Clostridium botulinum D/C]MCD3240296.1 tyrosine-type recombinase/integrase [Clostridium botulinum D/C]MCD3267731.1 tyrosine-type recombinase/integrase [Clostridium botulinum D/C]MCD3306128.1 tyrosine-type recombinase/integrase [Clostridium botulinum D/C]MCD3314912.1 tyrosine-type recombinase/integrase [Clostridium botulinum D/C]
MGKRKRASRPILENNYERFKYRLEELSGEWSERNLTLFLLDVATGYRVQDLVDLTIADIREALVNGYFEIQEKKQYNAWKTHIKKNPRSTKKRPEKRKHDIAPRLENILRNYIKGKKKSEYAFPSQKGFGSKHISAKAYSDILKKVANDKEIDLKNITGHSLRKTYARRLYEATNDLEYVRIALGHASIEVTKVYLGLVDEVKEGAAKIAARRL